MSEMYGSVNTVYTSTVEVSVPGLRKGYLTRAHVFYGPEEPMLIDSVCGSPFESFRTSIWRVCGMFRDKTVILMPHESISYSYGFGCPCPFCSSIDRRPGRYPENVECGEGSPEDAQSLMDVDSGAIHASRNISDNSSFFYGTLPISGKKMPMAYGEDESLHVACLIEDIDVYCDGSFFNQTGAYGFAAVDSNGRYRMGSGINKKYDSTLIELMAIKQSIMSWEGEAKFINIMTDSKSSVQFLNGQSSIRHQKYQREVSEILALVEEYRDIGGDVTISWVKGHSGNIMNQTADRISRHIREFQSGIRTQNPKEYAKDIVLRNIHSK